MLLKLAHVPQVETIAPKVAVPRNIEGRGKEKEKIISPSLKLTLVTQSFHGRFQGCQRVFL